MISDQNTLNSMDSQNNFSKYNIVINDNARVQFNEGDGTQINYIGSEIKVESEVPNAETSEIEPCHGAADLIQSDGLGSELFFSFVDIGRLKAVMAELLKCDGTLATKTRLFVMYRCLVEKGYMEGTEGKYITWANETFGLNEKPWFKGRYCDWARIKTSEWGSNEAAGEKTANRYYNFADAFKKELANMKKQM